MRIYGFVLLLAISAALNTGVLGQSQASFQHKIRLEISGDDELASLLRSSLRAIPDVALSDSSPDDIVKVLVLTVGPASRAGGLAASVVVTDNPTDVSKFWRLAREFGKCECAAAPEMTGLVGLAVADRVNLKGYKLFMGSLDRAELAHRIAAYVDNQSVEPARQAYDRLMATRKRE